VIRELRLRHRVWGVGALALGPLVLGAALLVRPTSTPPVTAPPGAPSLRVDALRLEFWPRKGSIAFRATSAPSVPDPLLYWAPVASGTDQIPSTAILLGTVAHTSVTVAQVSGDLLRGGSLVLWDGAHQRIVAVAPATGIGSRAAP
jgi:hypothetical protein